MHPDNDPLTAPPPEEVPLTDAPLVRVIAQLRFPEILSVERGEFVAPFQEALRETYPVLRHEQTQGVIMSPGGMAPAKSQLVWRFTDLEGDWRVSLAPEFVALETTCYGSRSNFLERLQTVLDALDTYLQPKLADRLGIRYIDRITGDAVDGIADLVRPEVRGILGTAAATHAGHALSESVFDLPGARVLARWGRLPGDASVDPSAIEPVAEPSWILDLDMSSVGAMPFAVDAVMDEAQRFVERIYTIFRWAVTDDFLRRYGGNP